MRWVDTNDRSKGTLLYTLEALDCIKGIPLIVSLFSHLRHYFVNTVSTSKYNNTTTEDCLMLSSEDRDRGLLNFGIRRIDVVFTM